MGQRNTKTKRNELLIPESQWHFLLFHILSLRVKHEFSKFEPIFFETVVASQSFKKEKAI